MNFTLQQLQVFTAVASWRSVTKAAKALNLTQPAVSVQLRNFQAQFDLPLTEIVGRRLYLTAFGEEIAVLAARIIEELDGMQHRAALYRGQLAGRLRLSTVSTGKYVIPYLVTDFMAEHPAINLGIDVTNQQGVAKNMADNEVDFSLVHTLPQGMELEALSLLPNELHLIGAGADKDRSNGLEGRPFIYREAGSGTRVIMETFIQSQGFSVRKTLGLTSNEAVKQAVLAGLGVSIMPLIGIGQELASGRLAIIPTEGLPIVSQWRLAWRRDKALSPVASAFLAYLSLHREDIVARHFSARP